MRHRACMALMALVCVLMLTSCNYNIGIEGLMRPPKLTEEQTQIYSALLKSTGQNITLKYPRSGDYRSAFVIVNLDEELTEEALVFYESNSPQAGENALRINVLDQRDGKWQSVYDTPGMGTDVDRVSFSVLDQSEQVNIIVGYSLLNQIERSLRVYTYADGMLSTVYNDSYTAMELLDIDEDGAKELLLLLNNTANATASARILRRVEGVIRVTQEAEMDGAALEYTALLRGVLEDKVAIYVDGTRSGNQIATEILQFQSSRLRNLAFNKSYNLLEKTVRPATLPSVDIDHDGVIEIPAATPFPGYEAAAKSEQLLATAWYVFENNEMIRKYYGYYNLSDGYAFMFPQRWQGAVTVKTDAQTGEIVFYKYDGALEQSITELMRIRTSGEKEAADPASNIQTLSRKGYEQIVAGSGDYFVKLATNKREPLVLTMSEIEFNFIKLIG